MGCGMIVIGGSNLARVKHRFDGRIEAYYQFVWFGNSLSCYEYQFLLETSDNYTDGYNGYKT